MSDQSDPQAATADLSGLKKWLADVVVSVVTNPTVAEALRGVVSRVVAERILPLVPIAIGAAVKSALDEMIQRVPGMEGVVDLAKTVDAARNPLNELIPDIDIGISAIDDLLDFWRPKH